MGAEQLELLLARLERIETALATLVGRQTVKDWYSPEEVAGILGKAPCTVQSWCRQGRINARKKADGRGAYRAWAISHDEVLRVQREGLLSPRTPP
jgi:Helix-turn-helix domain